MKALLLCIGTTLSFFASATFATPTIVVGNKVVAPGIAGQSVTISVTGGDAVQGLDLNAQIADGGPSAGGTVNGPHFTAADLITGTIFAPNNSGQQNFTSFSQQPQIYSGGIVTNSGTVNASGLLATFTVDTTGFTTPNTDFALRLTGITNGNISGNTDFAGMPAAITNGNLIIGYAGDLNLDGTVNFNDLLALAQNYGHTGATYSQGDINQDGTVNFNDLLTLAQNYGKSVNLNAAAPALAAAFDAVPEPASLGAIFALALIARRRRFTRR